MITLSDVTEWAIEKKRKYNYGHIVVGARDYWVQTLCGTVTPNWKRTKTVKSFDRVCQKCVKKMDSAILIINKEKEGGQK